MTEQLKTLMDRAADVDFVAPDLDAVTAAGDRVVRRRRVARGLAGLTAAVAAVTGAVLIAGEGADRSDLADSPFRSDVPTWTTGSTLHTPDATYDLGVEVASYVRSSAGIVFVGTDGGVYSFTGGRPERIGATEDHALRADPDAPYAAWVDGTGPDRATVVFDQTVGRRVWTEPTGRGQAVRVVAIDAGTAYLSQEPGATRTVDLASGAEGTLPEPGERRHLRAVGGDWAAWAVEKDGGADAAVEVTALGSSQVRSDHPGADGAAFSPDGGWISIIGEQVEVFDTATGEQVEVDLGNYPKGYGYEWLDVDTLLVVAGSEEVEEIALLSCEIPAGACTEQTTLPGTTGQAPFAIGVGEALP